MRSGRILCRLQRDERGGEGGRGGELLGEEGQERRIVRCESDGPARDQRSSARARGRGQGERVRSRRRHGGQSQFPRHQRERSGRSFDIDF